MESQFYFPATKDKKTRYEEFITRYAGLIQNEKDEISVMANTAAALREAFDFFWVGFYRVTSPEELSLGPFQGDIACYRIKKGRGVCGTAWKEARTLIVPVIYNKVIKGVLDIDSKEPDHFDETDRKNLETVVRLMSETLYT